MKIHITAEYDGRLLRSYLKLTLGLSTAVLAKLKNNDKGILVNGQRVTVRYVLHTGDILELSDRDTVDTASEHVIPTDLPLDVLYEDDHVIALNKPPHMPTHPSHGHVDDTLANALAYRYAQAAEPFVFRPLGRLDRNTSGVVVAGKTRAASGCLSRSLKAGDVSKCYVALLVGEMRDIGVPHTVTAPIYRPEMSGIRRAVGDATIPGCVHAETRYMALASSNGHSLVICKPITGRTHQLRVHFSHMGFPILGDDLYGAPSSLMDRHALHAISLGVPLPFFGYGYGYGCDHADVVGIPSDAPPISAVPSPNTPDCNGYLRTWAPPPRDMQSALTVIFGTDAPTLTFENIVMLQHELTGS